MSSRPIPFNKVQTMFWSYTGTAPEWFERDDNAVEAYKFGSLEKANEWMERRLAAGRELPERVIAMGEDGRMYWMREGSDPIQVDMYGNPDFSH